MGNKIESKRLMDAAGVPVLSELDPDAVTADDLPVLIKASAGGGGRGMRVVRDLAELAGEVESARAEAASAFGDPTVFCEPYLATGRHIEVQVMADQHGTVWAVGERECSIQRRHQKLLEESPAPSLSPALRCSVASGLRKAMAAIGYTNAGTVEFLMNENGEIYFIEVNARIQVEHPVTELVTGLDLVKAQIRIAAGEPLGSILTSPVSVRGHAIECRINAEHPQTFAPSPGRITALNLPGGIGVRVDTAAYTDGVIPPYYDSLVAKLITHGEDRQEAIQRMKRALSMFVIEGIETSISLHEEILSDEDFVAGEFDTTFLTKLEERRNREDASHAAAL
jgi:acetyl-CoA carboxylase biotin carboxylase subunit